MGKARRLQRAFNCITLFFTRRSLGEGGCLGETMVTPPDLSGEKQSYVIVLLVNPNYRPEVVTTLSAFVLAHPIEQLSISCFPF